MLLNEVLERNTHLFLNYARVVDMARNTEQLGALVPRTAETGEPWRTTSADGGGNRDGFDVRDSCWATEEANIGRERRLETGFTLLALEGLDERSLFTTDVRSRSTVEVDIEGVARAAGVLAKIAGFVRLIDRLLDVRRFLVELATDVDVGSTGVHGAAGHETTFDELMGVATHDFSVFASARLSLVGIDDEITRAMWWRGLEHA